MRKFSNFLRGSCLLQVGDIISRFEKGGFYVKGLKFINVDRPFAEKHYEDLSAKPFFSGLVDYIISGTVVAMIWEGKNVILTGQKIIGTTNPAESAPGTICGDYAIEIESSTHVKEDNFNIVNKSKLKGSRPIPGVEHAAFKTSKLGKLGEGVHQSNSEQKSLSFKELMTMCDVIYLQIYNEAQTDCNASDNEKIEVWGPFTLTFSHCFHFTDDCGCFKKVWMF